MLYVIGCGRSGTMYMTSLLKQLDINVGHEKEESDGEVGWRALIRIFEQEINPAENVVLHQVRNPLETIASLRTHTNEMLDFVAQYFPAQSRLGTAEGRLHRCMEYWYYWNVLSEEHARWTYRIEAIDEDWQRFCAEIGLVEPHPARPTIDPSLNTRRIADYAKHQQEVVTWDRLDEIDTALCAQLKALASRYGYTDEVLSDQFRVEAVAVNPTTSTAKYDSTDAGDNSKPTVSIHIADYLLNLPQVRSISPEICDDDEFFSSNQVLTDRESWTLAWGYPLTKRRFGIAETGFFWDAMHIDMRGLYQFSSLNTAAGYRELQEFVPPESGLNLIKTASLPQSKYRQPNDEQDWNGVVFACQNPEDRSIHSVASTEDWWRFFEACCRYYGSKLFVKLHPWNRDHIESKIRSTAETYGCTVGRAGHQIIEKCEHVVLFNSTFAIDCMVRGVPVKQAAPGYFSGTGAVSMCDAEPRRPIQETIEAGHRLIDFLVWKYCFSMDCTLKDWKRRLRTFANSHELFPLPVKESYGEYLRSKQRREVDDAGTKIELGPSGKQLSNSVSMSVHPRPRISFCTTCMGRLHYLCQTLPENITTNRVHAPHIEFVLLDYNSNDNLKEWLLSAMRPELESGLLSVYRTDEPPFFQEAHAKNVAHCLSTGEIVCNLDADNFVVPGYIRFVWDELSKQPASIFFGRGRDATGRVTLLRKHFLEMSGYNENMRGYGYTDVDLIHRAHRHLGLKRRQLGRFNRFISHSHAERVKNTEFSTLAASNHNNRQVMETGLQNAAYIANEGVPWGSAVVQKNYTGPKFQIDSTVASSMRIANGCGLDASSGTFTESLSEQHRHFDEGLANGLLEILPKEEPVLDLGCGCGEYLSFLSGNGLECLGIEGTSRIHESARFENIIQHDLRKPIPVKWPCSTVLCLEVAEHIPRAYEDQLLATIDQYCAHMLVISWAVPKQPGEGHVNCRPLSYVMERIEALGFSFDCKATASLRSQSHKWWFQRNLLVGRR